MKISSPQSGRTFLQSFSMLQGESEQAPQKTNGRVQRAWNQVVSRRSAKRQDYVYNQEKEVFAKLPDKRSREYIYQLLEKVKFPLKDIDGIIEKRAGMVDFTCTTRQTAEKLADVLSTRKEVTFARVRDPEYTDIKFHWVPADFPDERIREVLQRHYGEIRYSRILKDRRGKADGRRFYNVQTEKVETKTYIGYSTNERTDIPSRISVTTKTMLLVQRIWTYSGRMS